MTYHLGAVLALLVIAAFAFAMSLWYSGKADKARREREAINAETRRLKAAREHWRQTMGEVYDGDRP